MDLEGFLESKSDFLDSLSQEERDKYINLLKEIFDPIAKAQVLCMINRITKQEFDIFCNESWTKGLEVFHKLGFGKN